MEKMGEVVYCGSNEVEYDLNVVEYFLIKLIFFYFLFKKGLF